MPAIDKADITVTQNMTGIRARIPPRRSMERVPVAWSIVPATRNSADL